MTAAASQTYESHPIADDRPSNKFYDKEMYECACGMEQRALELKEMFAPYKTEEKIQKKTTEKEQVTDPIKSTESSETRLDSFLKEVSVFNINKTELNEVIYPKLRGIDELAEDIYKRGLLEPLVITQDFYLVSGHRRHSALMQILKSDQFEKYDQFWKVPCRILKVTYSSLTDDEFLQLLQSYNGSQRIKSVDELLREELVRNTDNKEEIVDKVLTQRAVRSVDATYDSFDVGIVGKKKRARISKAKWPMVEAIKQVVNDKQDFWPLTDRRIHYALLNNPPLRHASKPTSHYKNNKACYGDLCDLLTRLRLLGELSWSAITDETRPDVSIESFSDPSAFYKKSIDQFLESYCRNLLQSQPNYIQVVGEKNTIQSTIEPICFKYQVPYMITRGFSCMDIRYRLIKRFRESKKERLIILFLSDLDPEGMEIFHSFPRSLRDDFGLAEYELHTVRVALKPEQVQEYELPTSMMAKVKSTNFKKFAAEYGTAAYELEALPEELIQQELEAEIQKVLDWEAFEEEQKRERDELYKIKIQKQTLTEQMLPMLNNP